MALKVDMGKACSHVEWEFIRSRGRAKKKKKKIRRSHIVCGMGISKKSRNHGSP
jgi:hypothetical protein